MSGQTKNKANTKIQRSRGGCRECRRRHRKCDEVQPSCGYCVSVSKPCIYATQLRWGGRPFAKSRFGACLDDGVVAVGSGDVAVRQQQGFFYTTTRAVSSSPNAETPGPEKAASEYESLNVETVPDEALDDSNIPNPESTPPAAEHAIINRDIVKANQGRSRHATLRRLGILTPETQELRSYLEHFVHTVSGVMSCHAGMQDAFCSTFLSMAIGCDHLLHAVAALGAAHRYSDETSKVAFLRWQSVKQLRRALGSGQIVQSEKEQALATSLALCLADVVTSKNDEVSWKTHLQGASALVDQLDVPGQRESSPQGAHLKRLYRSILTIAKVCGPSDWETPSLLCRALEPHPLIDDMCGYSSALTEVFEGIHNLGVRESSRSFISTSDDNDEARRLFMRVQSMLEERKETPLHYSTTVPFSIQRDLDLLDEAYHHMALIQIIARVDPFIRSHDAQTSVKAILYCISQLEQKSGPSPFAASLPLLLAAGWAASDPADRDAVSELMAQMWQTFGVGNVRSTKMFLSRVWQSYGQGFGVSFQPLNRSESSMALTRFQVLPY